MDQNDLVSTQQPDMTSSFGGQPEKMIPQSQVDKIVKTIKLDVAQKAKEEALEEFQRLQSSNTQNSGMSSASAPSITRDDVRSLISEESQRQIREVQDAQLRQEADRIAHEFIGKMSAAKNSYADYDQVVGNLPFPKIANVVGLVNQFDNTADIMYELGKNAQKLVAVHQMAEINPELALRELHKISDSIKINQKAVNTKGTAPPLNQIPSSPVSSDDGSTMSVSDFRKQLRSSGR